MRSTNRIRLAACVVIGLVMTIGVLGGASSAVAGGSGSWQSPTTMTPLPWAAPVTDTTFDTGGGGLWLDRGKTIKFTGQINDIIGFTVYPVFDAGWNPPDVAWDTVSTSGPVTNFRLSAMATRSHWYYVLVESTKVATYSIDAAYTAPVKFTFLSLWVPKKAHKFTDFGVSTKIAPRYNGFSIPMKFEVRRLKAGKYRWYKTVASTWGSMVDRGTYSRYVATLHLKAGRYQVRAVFRDAAHSKAKLTHWKKVRVY
jgi:hypothetical protein